MFTRRIFQQTNAQLDPATYVTELRTAMQQLQSPRVRRQNPRKAYVNDDLKTCTHVFVRHDAIKKPLQKPYDSPFKVIKRNDKHFTLDVKGTESVIAIDRLKPAHIEELTMTATTSKEGPLPVNPTSPSTTRVTRSGHQVHWPKRLVTCVTINHFTGGQGCSRHVSNTNRTYIIYCTAYIVIIYCNYSLY